MSGVWHCKRACFGRGLALGVIPHAAKQIIEPVTPSADRDCLYLTVVPTGFSLLDRCTWPHALNLDRMDLVV
jgi:hypothetical protein